METEHKTVDTISPPVERTPVISNPRKAFSVGELELPEILNIPYKLLPLITEFNNYQYFLIEGGRSSGKSQSIARFLLYLAEQKRLRIVCGRETQVTIEESVYTIFKDLIVKYNLNFDTLKTAIDHRKSKSAIRFRGFREQGSLNIMGLEGCDILWFEQAEAATKQTLDVIIPTIRKANSKVIFSMNRQVEQDPAFTMFAMRTDCLHIHIDYGDNPHCPQKMIDEAEICKNHSLDDYRHIWLGEPLLKSEDYLFGMDMLRQSIDLDMNRIGVYRHMMGMDIARFGDCETVFSILRSHGPVQWEQLHQEAYKHKGIDETVGKALSLQKDFGLDALAIDDDGLEGAADFLDKYSFELFRFHTIQDWKDEPGYENYGTRRTAAYFKLQDWIVKGWIKILGDATLIEQLLTIRYRYEKTGRKILFTKDEMMKMGINSPDRADALAIAVWYADTLMTERFNQTEYAPIVDGYDTHFQYDNTNPMYAGEGE